jgi:hypothetical protein
MVTYNQAFLRHYKIPPLYESGVRYRQEPLGVMTFKSVEDTPEAKRFARQMSGRIEDFAGIPSTLHRKWGDCDDLAPWICAERREQGNKAKIKVKWRPFEMHNGQKVRGAVFHIVVRLQDGTEEDPSKVLGMGQHDPWKNPRLYR